MKIKSTTALANGKRKVVIELDESEGIVIVRDGAHYRLGGQVDDIVASHVLKQTRQVYWCSIAQQWVDA